MTVSPQYSQPNPEAHIVGKEQHDTTSKGINIMFGVGLVLIVPLLLLMLVPWRAQRIAREDNPELWSVIYVVVFLCVVLSIVFAVLAVKNFSCWIEGGYYVDYRHRDKSPTVRIYYKDIVCWSAQEDKTTVFDRFGQHIVVCDSVALPHLFRYLIENGVPVHANSSANTVEYLQERYRKSCAKAIASLREDLGKSQ